MVLASSWTWLAFSTRMPAPSLPPALEMSRIWLPFTTTPVGLAPVVTPPTAIPLPALEMSLFSMSTFCADMWTTTASPEEVALLWKSDMRLSRTTTLRHVLMSTAFSPVE